MKRILASIFLSVIMTAASPAAEPARMLNNKELKSLIAKATTPADHNRLAQHYRLKADKLDAEAKEHIDMARMYRVRPTSSEAKRPMSPDTAAHCDYFSESLSKAAKEARALAAAHAEMAGH